MPERNLRAGSTHQSLLRGDGLHGNAKNYTIKSILAYRPVLAMEVRSLSKVHMAVRMETGRLQFDHLLDSGNEGVTLHTLKCATSAGKMCIGTELRQPQYHIVRRARHSILSGLVYRIRLLGM